MPEIDQKFPLPKLKPCPFCGGKAEFRQELGLSFWVVSSEPSCDVFSETRHFDYSPEKAAFAWNKRA